jgi:hypothetical protein
MATYPKRPEYSMNTAVRTPNLEILSSCPLVIEAHTKAISCSKRVTTKRYYCQLYQCINNTMHTVKEQVAATEISYTGRRKRQIKRQSRVNIISQDSAVGVVTRLQAGRSGVRYLSRDKSLFSSLKRPYWFWYPPSLMFNKHRREWGYPVGKAAGAWG